MDLGKTCAALFFGAAPFCTQADPVSLSGQVDVGLRHYTEDGAFEGQGDSGADPFFGARLNGAIELGAGEVVLQFSYLRDEDNDRTFFNTQKAYYTNSFGAWDLVVGTNIENWGVSSGRTLVNVLNARNQTNQIGRSDFIGTPMVNANVFTGAGTFSLYVLADEVRDNFGGPATRQRGPFFVDDALTRYEEDDSVDVALRYANSLSLGDGALDIGVSVFDGTSREALALPGCVQSERDVDAAQCDRFNAGVLAAYEAGATPLEAALAAGPGAFTSLVPYYQEIRQYGLTATYVQGDTQLRFEGIHRKTSDDSFNAAIVGGDRTYYNAFGGEGTLIAALEYHFDHRSDRQPTTIYDNDLFLGVNYMHNDANDAKMDIGLFYDIEEASKIYTLSASRRVGNRLRVGLSANHIVADSLDDPLTAADGDSYVELSVSTFF